MNVLKAGLVFALVAGTASQSRATLVYYEVINGDLSNFGTRPTPITLVPGTSTIIAAVGGDDLQDWMAITVPAGYAVTAMIHSDYDSINPVSFVGFQQGPTFVGDFLSASSYWGYTHFGADTLGQDLLTRMADPVIAEGSQGFTPPLQSGVYTFFMQQFDEDTFYRFDFEVTAVPGAGGLAAFGMAGIAACRRRRHSSNRPG